MIFTSYDYYKMWDAVGMVGACATISGRDEQHSVFLLDIIDRIKKIGG